MSVESKKAYSSEREREYYKASPEDRRAVDYTYLTPYVRGSLGLDFVRGRRVLDIGCGEGTYAAWLADIGGAESVFGIELTEHRLRHDFTKSIPNLRLEAQDIFEYKPPMLFDTVFMNLVLHHLRFRLGDTVRRIFESLRPGGEFAAIEPNVYSPMAVLAHLTHDGSANEGFLSPGRIKKELLQAGFRDVRIGYFWRDRPWAKNPFLASSFWIRATKPNS